MFTKDFSRFCLNDVFRRWGFNARAFSSVTCYLCYYWFRMWYRFFASLRFYVAFMYLLKWRYFITLILMLLLPKRIKFAKSYSRSILSRTSLFNPQFQYGQLGLLANSNSFIIYHQISAILRPIRKYLKKQSKIWTFFAPMIPITQKPNEVRMGKGKGAVKHWALLVRKNQILFEFTNAKQKTIQKVISCSKSKLPFKSTLLSKH